MGPPPLVRMAATAAPTAAAPRSSAAGIRNAGRQARACSGRRRNGRLGRLGQRFLQRRDELGRRAVAPSRVLRERPPKDAVEGRRQVLAPLGDRRHRRVDVRRRLGGRRVVLVGPVAAQQLVGDDGECVEVTRGAGALSPRLLWREVARGPEDRPGERHRVEARRAGDSEVGDMEVVAVVQEQVRRLDVAMDDPVPVRGVERLGGLPEPAERSLRRLRPFSPEPVLKRAAAEVLHHDERPPAPVADVEDRDRARLARQPRRCEPLALEAFRDRRVGRIAVGEHLHDHLAPEGLVGRQIDVAHRTVADPARRAVTRRECLRVHCHSLRVFPSPTSPNRPIEVVRVL